MPTKGPHYDPNQPLKVHPVAALFPMMTEDELNDLAADIKANGLVHAIVLDRDGQLIDGRNRLEACGRAVIEQTFTTLPDGQDPVAFILSCNVNRRHLNKGQQAMAVAKAECFATKHSVRRTARETGVAAAMLSKARTVLEFLPGRVEPVLVGSLSLESAYEEARKEKEARESEEAKFARLQEQAPDIACMVQEERLTLTGALAELQERHRQEEQRLREELDRLQRYSSQFDRVLGALEPHACDPEKHARSFLELKPELVGEGVEFSAERARRAAHTLLRYAEYKEAEDKHNG